MKAPKISFERGALLVGLFVWGVLAVGILARSAFLIVLSSLTLALVLSVWIIIVVVRTNEWLKKRKFRTAEGVTVMDNYVSFVDAKAVADKGLSEDKGRTP